MKRLSILGSTGSIGQNTLKIVRQFPDQFEIISLSAKNRIDILSEQVRLFKPRMVAVFDEETAHRLKEMLCGVQDVDILTGRSGYIEAAVHRDVDMVVAAMVGAAGLEPVISAINAKKDIALANKETLVMAGQLVMELARQRGIRLLPVDSEHSAIFQSLQGQKTDRLDHIILTASGGPFLNRSLDSFQTISPADALKHPNWSMGAKISIDSSTMMNKGLEVIEARWLFDLSPAQIRVLIHPESTIHSMAAFNDGSIISQMGVPDMRGAIAYALSYPDRLPLGLPFPDFAKMGSLTFSAPDLKRFPCLSLAFDALEKMGTMPAVLNAANEIAVGSFLHKQIAFTDIYTIVRDVMGCHHITDNPCLDDIFTADRWAREEACLRVEALGVGEKSTVEQRFTY